MKNKLNRKVNNKQKEILKNIENKLKSLGMEKSEIDLALEITNSKMNKIKQCYQLI